MGRAVWMGMKFVIGALLGAVLGATATAYFSGAGEPAKETVQRTRTNALTDFRARLNAARTAGDLAAQEVEAAMTQQFRTKVNDPGALNPPNALHP